MIRWEGCDLPPNRRLGRISGWEVGSIKPSSVALHCLFFSVAQGSYSQNRLVCGFLKATASVPCICQSQGSFMCTEAACGCHSRPRVPRVLAGVPRGRCSSGGQGRAPGLARAALICRPQQRRVRCVPQIRAAMAIPAEPLGAAPSLQQTSNLEMSGQGGGLRPGALPSPIPVSFLGPRLCGRHRAPPRGSSGRAGRRARTALGAAPGQPRGAGQGFPPALRVATGELRAGMSRESPGSAGSAVPGRAPRGRGRAVALGLPLALGPGPGPGPAPAPRPPRRPRDTATPARSGPSARSSPAAGRAEPARPRPPSPPRGLCRAGRAALRTREPLQGPAGLALTRRSVGMAREQPQARSRHWGYGATSWG